MTCKQKIICLESGRDEKVTGILEKYICREKAPEMSLTCTCISIIMLLMWNRNKDVKLICSWTFRLTADWGIAIAWDFK